MIQLHAKGFADAWLLCLAMRTPGHKLMTRDSCQWTGKHLMSVVQAIYLGASLICKTWLLQNKFSSRIINAHTETNRFLKIIKLPWFHEMLPRKRKKLRTDNALKRVHFFFSLVSPDSVCVKLDLKRS